MRNLILFTVIFTIILPTLIFAQSVDDLDIDELRGGIDDKSQEIKEINKRIEGYNKEIAELEKEKVNLNTTLRSYTTTKNKTEAQIKGLELKINQSSLEIRRLEIDINDIKKDIGRTREYLASLYRFSNEIDQQKPFQTLLLDRKTNVFSVAEALYDSRVVKNALFKQVEALQGEEEKLSDTKETQTKERRVLDNSKGELVDRNYLLTQNITTQNNLIRQTNNEQGKYEKLVADNEAEREKLELELLEFESRLQFVLDPDSIPDVGAILSWPLRPVRLTQGFGCTNFARRNKQIYGGICFHPGIDLGASIGTKLTAPLAGIVRGVGNTDEKRGCYSFGKWIAIEHINGLTTIYAHLSVIKVREGDRVQRGDLIGYTGNSGISTGPHLDFRVYASEGVRIVRYEDINPNTSCRGVTIPTAHKDAKLNPLDYLPSA